LEYVNIFQGDFIMGLGPLFNLAAKFLGGAGASPQPATIQKTEVEQKPATALEQVNAAVITPPEQLNLQQQLHAATEPDPAKAVVVSKDQGFSNQELLEIAQKRAKEDPNFHAALMKASIPNHGVKIEISSGTIQKVLTFLQQPSLLKDKFENFLTTPMDKSLTESFGQYLKRIEPLLKIATPRIENYLTKLDDLRKQKISNPANTQAPTSNPV
jgi:hypothetical protein